MDRSLLSAVSGIDANQTWLDVIGNNIANANTTGFKQDNITFDSLLNQEIQGATAPNGVGLGGANGVSVGTGVKTAAITPDESQGTLQQTNDPTDVFINGNGYIIANVSGTPLYTRDGTLMFDSNGNLVTPTGGLVQGWEANAAGVINTSQPIGNITIPVGLSIPPQATANVSLGGNLPANAAPGTVETATAQVYDAQGNPSTLALTFTAAPIVITGANNTITFRVNGVGYTATIAAGTYSSLSSLTSAIQTALGAAEGGATGWQVTPSASNATFTITDVQAAPNNTFQITGGTALATLGLGTMGSAQASTSGDAATNQWLLTETLTNDAGFTYPTGTNTLTLTFNGSGVLQNIVDTTIPKTYTPGVNGIISIPITPNTPDAAGGTFPTFNLNFPVSAPGQNSVTQYGSADTLQVLSQDGFASGSLASLSIGQTGIITGSFTNGQNLALGQLAIANFANPTGLQQVGNNMWEGTANSGIALVGTAGTGGRGTITGGALEASNVDMSQQLTNLVVAQTSYQANTRVVTTNATVLNSLIQMA